MAYVTPVETASKINFLASAHFQSFTTKVAKAGVVPVNGKYIVPAGTVYPANTSAAKGILLDDVDVTYGDQPGALIVEGYILEARLPVAPSADAKTALKEIKFS